MTDLWYQIQYIMTALAPQDFRVEASVKLIFIRGSLHHIAVCCGSWERRRGIDYVPNSEIRKNSSILLVIMTFERFSYLRLTLSFYPSEASNTFIENL